MNIFTIFLFRINFNWCNIFSYSRKKYKRNKKYTKISVKLWIILLIKIPKTTSAIALRQISTYLLLIFLCFYLKLLPKAVETYSNQFLSVFWKTIYDMLDNSLYFFKFCVKGYDSDNPWEKNCFFCNNLFKKKANNKKSRN